ncbi:MAG: cyclic nucleotide-binding domain-containing protein [Acidobacteriota bacterium]
MTDTLGDDTLRDDTFDDDFLDDGGREHLDLDDVPFFAELEADLRRELGRCMVERDYSAGEVLFERGDAGLGLFVVFDGELAVLGPGDRLLARLGPGEIVGEMALLDGGARSATVRATEPTRCGLLSREDVLPLLRAEPRLALELVGLIARRVRSGTAADEPTHDQPTRAWQQADQPLLAGIAAATLGESMFRVARESLETLLGELRDGQPPRTAAKEAFEVAFLEGLRTPRRVAEAFFDRLDSMRRPAPEDINDGDAGSQDTDDEADNIAEEKADDAEASNERAPGDASGSH